MKKMRRLIPAIAMLLVSAVMLSTASFAWFTMNTEVTASGMEIQAKADSSLVISDAPLKYNTGAPDVALNSKGNKLTPMTWIESEGGWVVPTNTSDINTLSGAMVEGDVWKSANPTVDVNYIEKEVYIASAGKAIDDATIEITLTAPVSSIGSAVKAYAAALYVVDPSNTDGWKDNGTIDIDETPDKIVYVDTADGRNVVTFDDKYDIPSILGVGEQDEATTGLKIIIRFFVDGDLTSVGNDKVTVTTGYEYKQATGLYSASTQYYVAAPDTFKYNQVADPKIADIANYYVLAADGSYTKATGTELDGDTTYFTQEVVKNYNLAIIPEDMETTDTVLSTWFVREAITQSVNYKYIRTEDVPGTGSELEIAFSTK